MKTRTLKNMSAIVQRWDMRRHKRAIGAAYDMLCILAESITGDWCLSDCSTLQCGIIINPSDPKSGLEIISTPDGLVELHCQNQLDLFGRRGKSKRWSYTVVTVSGGGYRHDDPPPAVDESKPMSMDRAVREFAIAAITNKIRFESFGPATAISDADGAAAYETAKN